MKKVAEASSNPTPAKNFTTEIITEIITEYRSHLKIQVRALRMS